MDNINRINKMKALLTDTFSFEKLEIIDDSSKHIGHAGNTSGAGHFTLKIKSDYFTNKSRIESHRAIYKVLAEMIGPDIHALKIVFS